jgi:GntR family transcriptional regulator
MEFKDEKAIFLQIADHFLDNLLNDVWHNGERVASVRETAAALEVNANTVMRSYNYLQENGIIHNKRGIGYFFDDRAKSKAMKIKKAVFEEKRLPKLFQEMYLLDITIAELNDKYETYKMNQNEN